MLSGGGGGVCSGIKSLLRRYTLHESCSRNLMGAIDDNSSTGTIRLMNSLNGIKQDLPRGKTLTWYTCGPTVYDHSHVGHARAYVALDIVRRVLLKHGYSIFQVMGMTDVDDKIIAKSKSENLAGVEGSMIIARRFEQAFFNDMQSMNILPPDAITRVSEHIPEIVKFIQDLRDKGYAYEGKKSSTIWFDTAAYGSRYGVFEPLRVQEDASNEDQESEKKNHRDFALWKPVASVSEAGWESELGRGRPGWHIECSAFCRTMFGEEPPAPFLHSGGRDLKFPHHENEIAQSQALLNTDRWVSHWLHAGQLTIKGLKMSKSLKNYTSIQDFLTAHSSRTFRIFCLLHKYSADVSYGEDRMEDALAWEKSFENFFRELGPFAEKRYLQEGSSRMLGDLKWEAKHHALNNAYLDCQLQIRSALEDDVDTPTAMRHLKNLIRDVNVFLRDVTDIRKQRNLWPLLTNITHYVQDSLEGWGVDCSDWVQSAKVDITTNSHEAPAFDQAIEVLLAVRSELRTLAIKHKKAKLKDDGALANELLGITDKIRDSLLPGMGVEVKDRQGQSGEMVHTWTFNPRLIASQQDEAKTDSK
uniref:cysteine--tRNA ligase n=1 Tax=Hanusia phi TaxID=3032 RepID=A0A7S0I3B7_9CRYP